MASESWAGRSNQDIQREIQQKVQQVEKLEKEAQEERRMIHLLYQELSTRGVEQEVHDKFEDYEEEFSVETIERGYTLFSPGHQMNASLDEGVQATATHPKTESQESLDSLNDPKSQFTDQNQYNVKESTQELGIVAYLKYIFKIYYFLLLKKKLFTTCF